MEVTWHPTGDNRTVDFKFPYKNIGDKTVRCEVKVSSGQRPRDAARDDFSEWEEAFTKSFTFTLKPGETANVIGTLDWVRRDDTMPVLPGGCDFIVSDSILARNPGRSSGPHLWRAGSCGLRVVQNPRPSPISVFRGCFHSRSVSPVAFSPRHLSWLRINRPVARPTASLDTERGVSAYSGGFPPLELTPFPGRNWTVRGDAYDLSGDCLL